MACPEVAPTAQSLMIPGEGLARNLILLCLYLVILKAPFLMLLVLKTARILEVESLSGARRQPQRTRKVNGP